MLLKLALKKCIETAPSWSIHGLWIDNDNGTWPEYCSHMHFDPIPPDMLHTMEDQWYSCEGDNYGFWGHELKKHGSCIKKYIDEDITSTILFNTTLLLFEGMVPYLNYYCGKGIDCFIKYLRNPDVGLNHN